MKTRRVTLRRALYLDGNNLQCEGAMNLIRPFAEQAVLDDMLKQAEAADEATATDKPTQRQDGKVCINQRDSSLGLETSGD